MAFNLMIFKCRDQGVIKSISVIHDKYDDEKTFI